MHEKHAVRSEMMIQIAIALNLTTLPGGIGKFGESLGRITQSTKHYLGDPLITASRIKEVIHIWVLAGWAVIEKKYLRLTARGMQHLLSIANAAV